MVKWTMKSKSKSSGKFNTIDKVLLGCATFMFLFTIVMIILFCIYQTEPTTLITSVFGVVGGETVLSFFIWYIKKRYTLKQGEDKDELCKASTVDERGTMETGVDESDNEVEENL